MKNRFHPNRDHHLVRSGIHSFYVTKFQETILPSDMWRACSQLGKVVDVFISNKKSRMRKRIRFVRFSGIQNVDHMIKKLCDVWFGYHKMFDSVLLHSISGRSLI